MAEGEFSRLSAQSTGGAVADSFTLRGREDGRSKEQNVDISSGHTKLSSNRLGAGSISRSHQTLQQLWRAFSTVCVDE